MRAAELRTDGMTASAAAPIFPLHRVLLPGERMALRIFEPRYREMLTEVLAGDRQTFGVVLIKRGSEVGGGEARHTTGTLAEIVDVHRASDGSGAIATVGREVFDVARWLPDDPFPRAAVTTRPRPTPAAPTAIAGLVGAVERYAAVADLHGLPPVRPPTRGRPSALQVAVRLPIGEADRYAVLAARTESARITLLTDAVAGLVDQARFRGLAP